MDFQAPLIFLAIVAIGVLLCLCGDYVRRRTDGRIRHAEIHLLAWLPALVAEAIVLLARNTTAMAFLFPLVIPAFVYLYWFVRIQSTRNTIEEKIDSADEKWRLEQIRRDRIEAYKHGSMDLRPMEPGGMTAPSASRQLPLSNRESLVPRPAVGAKGRKVDKDESVLGGLKGWRMGVVLGMQLAVVADLMFTVLFGVDNLLQTAAPVDPVFFWISGAVDIVLATLIVAMTRTLAFVVPTLAMALSLAGLLESFRIRMAATHAPFLVYTAYRLGSVLVIACSVGVFFWALNALWSRKRAA